MMPLNAVLTVSVSSRHAGGSNLIRILTALLALVALSGCASDTDAQPAASACDDGFEEFAEYSLFFGRSDSTGAEVVSEEAWNEFLADTVTPRFPDGLTVTDGRGQWQLESGAIQKEDTKVLYILTGTGDGEGRLLDELSEEYKRRFGQESVLLTSSTTCVSFK